MRKIKLTSIISSVFILILFFGSLQVLFSQIQRNPVLEFCTGTW